METPDVVKLGDLSGLLNWAHYVSEILLEGTTSEERLASPLHAMIILVDVTGGMKASNYDMLTFV